MPGLRTITPPAGVLVAARNAVFLQREAVHHGAVHGDMVDADRIVGEGRVEIVAVEQAAVRHDGVVIAVAHDHFALGNLAFLGELLHLGDDAGTSLPGPDGGA